MSKQLLSSMLTVAVLTMVATISLAAPIISSLDTPGDAIKIAISGNYAYVTDGSGWLRLGSLKPDFSSLFPSF